MLPTIFRQQVMQAVHNASHYGNKRTYRAIAQSYWWPRMGRDINEFVMNCEVCQRNKTGRRLQRPWVKFPQTSRLKTIHIDLVHINWKAVYPNHYRSLYTLDGSCSTRNHFRRNRCQAILFCLGIKVWSSRSCG